MRLRTVSTQWNVPGKYGPCGELFFFLLKKEPRVFSELVRFGPSISAEKVKACALIGLHIMAEENSWRSDSGSSVSSSSWDENNAGNDALFVIGPHGPGDTTALFLQDWEVAMLALSCHTALDMLCQELHEVERETWLVQMLSASCFAEGEGSERCPSELSWQVCFLQFCGCLG